MSKAAERSDAINKARRYVEACEKQVTNAMHLDDPGLMIAFRDLRQAKIRLHDLENSK